MKHLFSFITLAGLLLAGCDKKEAVKAAEAAAVATAVAQPPKQEAPGPKLTMPQIATPDSFQAGIGKVYAGYLAIGSALTHDDSASAQSASQLLLISLHALPKAGMDSTALNPWDTLEARLMRVLQPLADAKDMAAMRDHLSDLTPLMVEALEKFGSLGPDAAVLFHCPMARNNQGADWLQRNKKVANPFLGKAMPDCGSFVKDVKP